MTYFKFTNFKKKMKIGLSAVGKTHSLCYDRVCNALTCLYGNNTSTFSEFKPPSLDEYFG